MKYTFASIKKIIAFNFLLTGLILSSCAKYTNLYEVKPTSENISEDNFYQFENDTLKITYSFFGENGVLAYTFYNKLNIPIYIDWKKSSLIRNDQKSDYWVDETKTKSQTKYSGYSYSGVYTGNLNLLSINSWNSTTITNSIKPERITFLAPKSSITRVYGNLYSATPQNIKGTTIKDKLLRYDKKKSIPVEYVELSQQNTPFIFRNFISISTSEKFDKENYVDNGFFVSRIYKINRKYFQPIIIYNSSSKKDEFINPLINPKWFFIDL